MYGRDVCNGHHHHKVYKIKKLDFSIRTFNQVVERSTKAPAALLDARRAAPKAGKAGRRGGARRCRIREPATFARGTPLFDPLIGKSYSHLSIFEGYLMLG